MSDDMMIGRSKDLPPSVPSSSSSITRLSIIERFSHPNMVSERTRAHVNQSAARPKKVEEMTLVLATQRTSALTSSLHVELLKHAQKAAVMLVNGQTKQHDDMAQCVKKLEVALLFLQTK